MKIIFKIISFLFVIAFCVTTVNANESILPFHHDGVTTALKPSAHKSTISADSFSIHTKEYDRVITEYFSTTPSLFLKQLDPKNGLAYSSQQLFIIEYSKYIQFLKNLKLCFSTIDIIYPFHSFW